MDQPAEPVQAARSAAMRDLSIRQCLMLPFATLVALLVLIAWLEGGA